ncbi:hypothetical protein RD792_009903 [Penstemon davidsonii]|uniref:Late embryogenesis abundant protein LEA-2 subgroup domain-containing protein n=1 Tax=Penstemon davidsonii TaxID=160366 RepID=A0ABR0D0C8_9LAMI|nr:hypothetical protein RD792_009885 [Penstemon davidsonii]KAK4482736.1 hypothetical protein RD792_009903 [Penstemon davidsonii]
MSTKYDCGHHENPRKKLYRRLLAFSLGLILLILLIILITWLILRPTKPHFTLQDVTVYAFNLSSPNLLTTTLQITLTTHNPNGKVGIYYDKLHVYASYHSQQITLPTLLPDTYQQQKDDTVWSPFVYGIAVPIPPYVAVNMNQDQSVGTVVVNVRVDGRVRWRVGTFVSRNYHLNVNCPAYIGRKLNIINNNGLDQVGTAGVKYQLVMDCHVDV